MEFKDSKTYQNANTILNIPFFKYYNLLEIKESSPYILCAKYYALFLYKIAFKIKVDLMLLKH